MNDIPCKSLAPYIIHKDTLGFGPGYHIVRATRMAPGWGWRSWTHEQDPEPV